MWKAKNAANYARNPDKCRAQSRASGKKHREKRREYHRKKYEENRDERRTKMQAFYQETRLNSPWKLCLASAKSRAKKSNMLFDLDETWAIERWTGNCEMSGIAFSFDRKTLGPQTFSPTIDRIDSAKGYTKDNSRFVLWAINAFKGSGCDNDILTIVFALHKKFF